MGKYNKWEKKMNQSCLYCFFLVRELVLCVRSYNVIAWMSMSVLYDRYNT